MRHIPKGRTDSYRWLRATTIVLGVAVCLHNSALAGRKNKKTIVPSEEATPAAAPAPLPPSVPTLSKVFNGTLPVDIHAVPEGLANLSAQGCNACHYEAHESWAASAHSSAASAGNVFDAAERSGIPACLNCHLPIAVQQPSIASYLESDVNHVTTSPNPNFDATLFGEGVTCAACHIREGRVITSTAIENSPHPTTISPQLNSSEVCAACHQLSWEGADKPLYDTYGEWKRSGYSAADIQCQDCHMRSGQLLNGTISHNTDAPSARAISVLIDLSTTELQRGGPPIHIAVTIQNTGAGHSFPTGSPFKGARLTVHLEGPEGSDGKPQRVALFQADIQRQVETEPPWHTISDTRIGPGKQQQWHSKHSLGFEHPAGEWFARVEIDRTLNGFSIDAPIFSRAVPLVVD